MQYVAIIAFDQRGEGQKRRLNLMTHLWSCSDLGHQKFISQAASTDNDNVGGLNTQKTPHLHPEWTTDTHILITGPEEGLKIQEGGSSNVVSIICPLSALVEIGLTDLSKSGFHGILESDRPFLLLRRYTVLCAMVYLHFKYCQLAFLPTKTVDYQSYTYTRIPNKCTSSDFGQFLN